MVHWLRVGPACLNQLCDFFAMDQPILWYSCLSLIRLIIYYLINHKIFNFTCFNFLIINAHNQGIPSLNKWETNPSLICISSHSTSERLILCWFVGTSKGMTIDPEIWCFSIPKIDQTSNNCLRVNESLSLNYTPKPLSR